MSMLIRTNVAAYHAYRNLTSNQNALSKTLQRLSSGLRINSAADDAAGLAISEGLKSQTRGTAVAIRNAQDGISVAQTAEGALQEYHSLLQRLRDLAVQSANGVYHDGAERQQMQTEADQLMSEIDRIVDSTKFNGQGLLDGTFKDVPFQVGANSDDQMLINLAGALVQAYQPPSDPAPLAPTYLAIAGPDSGDWIGTAHGGTLGQVTFSHDDTSYSGDHHEVTVDLSNANGIDDVLATLNSAFAGQGFAVVPPSAGQTKYYTGSLIVRTTFNTDDAISATGGGIAANSTGYSAALGGPSTLSISFGDKPIGVTYDEASQSWVTTTTSGASVGDAQTMTQLRFQLEGRTNTATPNPTDDSQTSESFTIDLGALGINPADDDDIAAVANAIRNAIANNPNTAGMYDVATYGYSAPSVDPDPNHMRLYSGNLEHAHYAGSRAQITITAKYPMSYADEQDDLAVQIDHASAGSPATFSGTGTYGAEPDGYGSITYGMSAYDPGHPAVYVGFHTWEVGLDPEYDITTQQAARDSIDAVDKVIKTISNTRAYLGAIENRFTHAIGYLQNTQANLSESLSRIQDADMAQESMSLSRAQILQQAGVSVLSQANLIPQQALRLLN